MTPAEKTQLDELGYLLWPDVLALGELRDVRDAVASASRGPQGESDSGTAHVDLDPSDARLIPLVSNPRVLSAVEHVVAAPFVVSLHARDPRPGFGLQGLHADWLPRTSSTAPYVGVTLLWMIDAFEHDGSHGNGATRIVTGTHRQARVVPESYRDPHSDHPDQQTIAANAGSVLLFNMHLWHAGTKNTSAGPRLAIQQQYLRADLERGRMEGATTSLQTVGS